MITWIFLAVLAQVPPSDLQRQAPELVAQASGRVFDAHEALAFKLGECARVLPTGGSLPSVREARAEAMSVGMPELDDALDRIHAVAFAEGLATADRTDLSPRRCADQIDELAGDQVQFTRGLAGLIETVMRDAQR